nr:hypothetical protein [Pirellula sp.]
HGIRLRFGTRSLLWMTLVVAIICSLISFAYRMYYSERYAVESFLKEIDGIGYSISTHEDFIEEVASVTITLKDLPDSRIVVYGLATYESRGAFALGEIGKWRFVIQGRRFLGATDSSTGEPVESNYWGGCIQLGADNPYEKIIPYPTHTLQDIIDHYEELVDYLDTWPRESDPGQVILEDGSVQKYYVLDTGK